MGKKNYYIMDGRAEVDIDRALVLETFRARGDQQAFDYLDFEWGGSDNVVATMVDGQLKVIQRPL